jgi:hypothetical protein
MHAHLIKHHLLLELRNKNFSGTGQKANSYVIGYGLFERSEKKPLKVGLLLQGLRREDLKSFSPHSTPHFSAWFFQQEKRR